VLGRDGFLGGQVGNGAGHLQDAVVGVRLLNPRADLGRDLSPSGAASG